MCVCVCAVSHHTRARCAAPVARKVAFLYLANHVIQTSRHKHTEFLQAFGAAFAKALPVTYRYQGSWPAHGVIGQAPKAELYADAALRLLAPCPARSALASTGLSPCGGNGGSSRPTTSITSPLT